MNSEVINEPRKRLANMGINFHNTSVVTAPRTIDTATSLVKGVNFRTVISALRDCKVRSLTKEYITRRNLSNLGSKFRGFLQRKKSS